ncbi:hypothetical protein GCM10023195_82730 [Actinoallomurus liliacearum]|uniref:Uncharacterized protein n=1 Tax=Actinoallomurus liliacearum TaxID=1080073 RepID=A0ABP8TWR4_9ACTN
MELFWQAGIESSGLVAGCAGLSRDFALASELRSYASYALTVTLGHAPPRSPLGRRSRSHT